MVIDQFSLHKSGFALAFALGLSIRFCTRSSFQKIYQDPASVHRARVSEFHPFPIIPEQSSRNWFAESRTRSSSGRGGAGWMHSKSGKGDRREGGREGGDERSRRNGGSEKTRERKMEVFEGAGRWSSSQKGSYLALRLCWGR